MLGFASLLEEIQVSLIIPPALPDRRLSDDFFCGNVAFIHGTRFGNIQVPLPSAKVGICECAKKNWKTKLPLAFFQFRFLLIFIQRCRRSVTMAQLAAALLTAGSRYWNELIGNWFHCVAVEDEERRCQPSEDLRPRQQSSRKIRFNDFKLNVNDIILIRLITAIFFLWWDFNWNLNDLQRWQFATWRGGTSVNINRTPVSHQLICIFPALLICIISVALSTLADLSYRQVFSLDGANVELEMVDVSNQPVKVEWYYRIGNWIEFGVIGNNLPGNGGRALTELNWNWLTAE